MTRRPVAVLVGLSALAIVVLGCSGTPTPDVSTSPAAIAPQEVSPADLPAVPELGEPVGVRNDVEIDDCRTDAPLTASGTVTNTADQESDIVIVVNWATDRGDVLARGIASIEDVEPGGTADWTASSEEKPSAAVECVISAQRGTLP